MTSHSSDYCRRVADHYLRAVDASLDRAERGGLSDDERRCHLLHARRMMVVSEDYLGAAATIDRAEQSVSAAEAAAEYLAGIDPLAPCPPRLRLAGEYAGGVEVGDFGT